jgi:hypothetical protein
MDFLFKMTKEDLINTLDTLEQDINLQKKEINELVIEEDRKEKYITDDVNVVKSIIEKLDYKELKALQTVFYEMEQYFYMMNRTEEEQQAFVKGVAEDINDLPTARFDFEGDEEEEDDWTKLD